MAESKGNPYFSNKLYNRLKFIALVFLPALGTLCYTIGNIWGFAHTDDVVGTIAAIDLFLGTVLKISTTQYYKKGKNFDGEITIIENKDGTEKARFDLNEDPVDAVHDDPGKHSFEYRVQKETGGH